MTRTESTSPIAFRADEVFARSLDDTDPLREQRDRFLIPKRPDGEPVIYLCGNSLGLQPTSVRAIVDRELDDWAAMGVEGHFKDRTPWYPYHELFREVGARLVGAVPGEVVMMNSLTVNLHLMMVSFFHPQGNRQKILIEDPCFPSDIYAVKTHLQSRGLDPAEDLIVLRPREGEHIIRMEDIEAILAERGEEIALVLLAGVNFFTGQVIDMARITKLGHEQGCVVGFDLAHAAGNVPMQLHDWDVDFAAWCSYKYLNGGPGAVAGCFVHEKHGQDTKRVRYAGWWGNDPETRFRMHLQPEFMARPGADGWQLSNPPILAMAPVLASLEIFDEVGMAALRDKSRTLTGYLRFLLNRAPHEWFQIITPVETDACGCQLSILVNDQPMERFGALQAEGVVCDFRQPNVIRVAPVPLYNTYRDVWRFAEIISRQV